MIFQPQHLDTPRQITDTQGNVVWQWDNSDPFGNNPPNENPSGQGTFTNNLGFPGQYRDRETNTFYNTYRDAYDSATGRYTQFDPIGLAGGINGFIYANGNPLSYTDMLGLCPFCGAAGSGSAGVGGFGGLGGFGHGINSGKGSKDDGDGLTDPPPKPGLHFPSWPNTSSSTSQSAQEECEAGCNEKKKARDALCFVAKARGGKAAQKLCLSESDAMWIECLEKCKKDNCPK